MVSGTVVVLGGAGFIGSNFVREALDSFDSVVVYDKLTYAGNRQNLEEVIDEIRFVEADIRERDVLKDEYEGADYVVNFAAESHVDRSISGGRQFVRSNVEGAFVAMDLLRDVDIKEFVQVSTDEVYGSIEEGSFVEGDKLDPSSPYSASKASADMFVNAMWETYGLPVSVVRPTNAYGPRQHPEKLIPKFTLNALRGEPLPVYGDGSNVRQWLHVKDLNRAVLEVLLEGDHDIYNIAGPDMRTNLEVTRGIIEHTGADEDLIEFVEDRKGHDQRYSIDGSKIEEDLNFEPTTNFDEGLESTVEWYVEHSDRFVDD